MVVYDSHTNRWTRRTEEPYVALALHKAIQATAVLLRHTHGGRMSYLRLMKLLYIAEREAVRDTARPITGDRVVAMPHGPVLSNLLNIIKDEDSRSSEWRKYVGRENYDIACVADPGIGRLNRYEVRKLEEVSARFANHNDWELVEHTHTLPEWIKNNPGKSSKEIPTRDILDAVGLSAEADRILADLKEEGALEEWIHKGPQG